MKAQTAYRVVGREEILGGKADSRELAAALSKDRQWLLPILDLITTGRAVVDRAIDVVGQATIEALLELSAREVAGAPHQGRKGCGITRYGRQGGAVKLFTVNRLGLPASLRRCLATTNIIESPQSTVRRLTHKVDNWRDGAMALRWAAASFVEAEKTMRKIGGHRQVWMLAVALERQEQRLADARKTG
jgi:hypothetical protein